ncbi:ubiquitin-conjugating enzyme E2-binding protein [Halteromyces radiatus]|uniref:ubiquitin-conjugating enzyme E2-binding protein n=1 Tax=Halteromyces radiatus TaxID=101107 RepID=UPI00221F8BE8|nr:ubiquitin-conjugating enzyme E2-binding protein [Halteromyces radiatus]KAI8084936.1 ubiquitin-conjugating enzyme E2-binding protein [Halteromyces radiatus]
MTVSFYAELLSNIQVLRATIATDESVETTSFTVKNNQLWQEDTVVVDLTRHGLQADPHSLQVQAKNDESNHGDRWIYQLKVNLQRQQQTTHSSSSVQLGNNDKEWWTAKDMIGLQWQQLQCRHCAQILVENKNNNLSRCKDLPSEHWYELVECWICHETKPEEHQARMRPILAQHGTLLVGSFYFLIHVNDLVPLSIKLDQELANQINWERGTMTKWISINCNTCGKVIGEGLYECQKDQELNMLALKLYKYCLTIQPNPPELPDFMNFVVGDMVDAAKVHATHRFVIQGKKSSRVYALVWLFNWDTTFIYNDGFKDEVDDMTGKIDFQRGMKILYMNTKDDDQLVKKWNHDKTTDHLIYPDTYCQQLVKSLESTTNILPPSLRTMNHPSMPMTKNFSVGFIHRK